MSGGKYDIVYMIRDSSPNEELRHSLRSVEKNWGPHGPVWFFGGCPDEIHPDRAVPVGIPVQDKWTCLNRKMRTICECEDVSEDFWLFNDDFFVMRPVTEDMPQQTNMQLHDAIRIVEAQFGGVTYWTQQLRLLIEWAGREGFGTVNFEVHKPMRINRRRMLDVMDRYPDVLFYRSLYGNFYAEPGESSPDILVTDPAAEIGWISVLDPAFISSTEDSFAGNIGRRIRALFPEKCRYEVT